MTLEDGFLTNVTLPEDLLLSKKCFSESSTTDKTMSSMEVLLNNDIVPNDVDLAVANRAAGSIENNVTKESKYWFHAKSNVGHVYIGLSPNNAKNNHSQEAISDHQVLDAALTLNREEGFICWLEQWLQTPFDADLSHPPTLSAGVKIVFSNDTDEKKDHPEIIVCIPLELLVTLDNPYISMPKSYHLTWQPLNCMIDIAHFDVPAEQIDTVVVGGMVLIPNSFQEKWMCSVKTISPSLDGNGVFFARLDVDAFSLGDFSYQSQPLDNSFLGEQGAPISSVAPKTNKVKKTVSLEFVQPHIIPVNYLMGWFKPEEAENMFPLNHDHPASVAMSNYEWVLKLETQIFAMGHLLPIADGFGLLINKCIDH